MKGVDIKSTPIFSTKARLLNVSVDKIRLNGYIDYNCILKKTGKDMFVDESYNEWLLGFRPFVERKFF